VPNPVWPVLILLGTSLAAGEVREAVSAESPGAGTPQQPAPNSVQALDYAVLPGGKLLIKLTFGRELTQPPTVLASHHPTASITFDFVATTSAAGKEPIEINQRGLRSLQLIQAQGRTRLVISLTRPHIYETEARGRELLITLHRPVSLARSEEGSRAFGGTSEARHNLRNVSFQPGAAGEGRIIVELSDAAIPVEVRQQGKALIVDFLDSALPPHLARRLDVLDFGTPVQTIETYRVGNAVRMRIELERAGEYAAYQLSRQFIVAPRAGER